MTEDGMLLFHISIRKDLFWFEIHPETCMYLNYLAIYEGTWSAEQLGIDIKNASRQADTRGVSSITYYTTDTNSYTFKDLNTNSRFFYRVRTLGVEDTYSLWSEEKAFTFSGTSGIPYIPTDSHAKDVYDLQGRKLSAIKKGIYIIDGKKVIR